MATSLYGTVKKIGSSQFTFDRIYTSRLDMEEAMENDAVYHGRYVLISYGDNLLTPTNSGIISITNTNSETAEITNYTNMSYNSIWLENYNKDISRYNNIYDKTVWQKIFDGAIAKYIMVASLSARAPGLTINEDYYSFNLNSDNNGEIYYIKNGNDFVSGTYKASYPIPKWNLTYSNDLIYHLDMPMPLHVNLAKDPEYFKEGLSPYIHSSYDGDTRNYIHWEHILKNTNEVTGADFCFNVPKIGQAVSDLYDAMYGVNVHYAADDTEHENPLFDGTRPFITFVQSADEDENLINLKLATQDALAQTDYKGLLYILSKIGLRAEDGHYLLGADWDADETAFGHIENKPDIITNLMVAENGLWTFTAIAQ